MYFVKETPLYRRRIHPYVTYGQISEVTKQTLLSLIATIVYLLNITCLVYQLNDDDGNILVSATKQLSATFVDLVAFYDATMYMLMGACSCVSSF